MRTCFVKLSKNSLFTLKLKNCQNFNCRTLKNANLKKIKNFTNLKIIILSKKSVSKPKIVYLSTVSQNICQKSKEQT